MPQMKRAGWHNNSPFSCFCVLIPFITPKPHFFLDFLPPQKSHFTKCPFTNPSCNNHPKTAQTCQKNTKKYEDCAKNDKKCALFTNFYKKITKNTPFFESLPRVFRRANPPQTYHFASNHKTQNLPAIALAKAGKPNLRNAQMNISQVLTRRYKNLPLHGHGNTNPIQTQSPRPGRAFITRTTSLKPGTTSLPPPKVLSYHWRLRGPAGPFYAQGVFCNILQ